MPVGLISPTALTEESSAARRSVTRKTRGKEGSDFLKTTYGGGPLGPIIYPIQPYNKPIFLVTRFYYTAYFMLLNLHSSFERALI